MVAKETEVAHSGKFNADYFRPFTLVSVCYDRGDHLIKSLNSWFKQDYPNIQIVIVLGGPNAEKTLQQIFAFGPYRNISVLMLKNCNTYRPSYFRNIGVTYAPHNSEYIGFVDCDVRLHFSWASVCVHALQKTANIIVHEYSLNDSDAGGCSGTLAIARWLFEKIRGYSCNLDERWGYEDTDLIVRAQKAGGQIDGYTHLYTDHIEHGVDLRTKYFPILHEAHKAKTFVQQMWIANQDSFDHPYEANRTIKDTRMKDPTVWLVQR